MTRFTEEEAAEVAHQVYLEEAGLPAEDREALLERLIESVREELPGWLEEQQGEAPTVLGIQLVFGWGDERDNDAIELVIREMVEAGEIAVTADGVVEVRS
ncbi:MAG TPA: hypothetical protein VFV36_05355 [Candidatus Methylomirabilis sp.]|nr:hypothetical protein [Candidatus Methylomirabilis sp.]